MHVICFLYFYLPLVFYRNKQITKQKDKKLQKVNCQNDIEVNYIRMHFEIKLSGPKNGTVIVNDILLFTKFQFRLMWVFKYGSCM